MKGGKDLRRNFFSPRDFLKISGLSIEAVVLAEGSNNRLSFAKDVYPMDKITCIVAHKPGGGYDLISRGVAPYLGKYLREISPGAKGGDVVIKNEGGHQGTRPTNLFMTLSLMAIPLGPLSQTLPSKR